MTLQVDQPHGQHQDHPRRAEHRRDIPDAAVEPDQAPPAVDTPTPAGPPAPGSRREARLRSTPAPTPDATPTLPGPATVLAPTRRRSGPGWIDLRELDGRSGGGARRRRTAGRAERAEVTVPPSPAQAPTSAPRATPRPSPDADPDEETAAFRPPEAHAPFRATADLVVTPAPACPGAHAPFRAAVPRQGGRTTTAVPFVPLRVPTRAAPAPTRPEHSGTPDGAPGEGRPQDEAEFPDGALPPEDRAGPDGLDVAQAGEEHPAPVGAPTPDGPRPTAGSRAPGAPVAREHRTAPDGTPVPGDRERPAVQGRRRPTGRPPCRGPGPAAPATRTAPPPTASQVSLDAAAIAASAMDPGARYPDPALQDPPQDPQQDRSPTGRSRRPAPARQGAPGGRPAREPLRGERPQPDPGPQPGARPAASGSAPRQRPPRLTRQPLPQASPQPTPPPPGDREPAPRRARSRALPLLAVVGVVLGVYGGVSLGDQVSVLHTGSDGKPRTDPAASTTPTSTSPTAARPSTAPSAKGRAASEASPVSVTPSPRKTAAVPAAGTSATGTVVVPVYWVTTSSTRSLLAREYLQVRNTGGAAASAVRAVLEQRPLDPDYTSPWHRARTVTVRAASGGITVDLSSDAFANTSVSSGTATAGIQQLVWTVTSAAQQDVPVTVLVDGARGYRAWGSVSLDQPLRRDARARTSVWIDGPHQGALLPGPVHVTGQGDAAGRVFRWKVTDGDRTVASGVVTGTAASPSDRSQFAFDVSLPPGRYLLTVAAQTSPTATVPGGRRWPDTKALTVR